MSELEHYLTEIGISDEVPTNTVHITEDHAQVLLEQFISGLIAHLDPSLQYDITASPDLFEIHITGNNAPQLAGDGSVITAIELIAYTILNKHTESNAKIRIDIGEFRKRHAQQLSIVAQRIADQVASTGEEYILQPMNAADRRTMHLALQEHPLVMTESQGEGKARHLVIKPRPV